MASKRISGITIKLGADSSPMQKALKDVESTSKSLNRELGQVNKLLKFDPGNTALVAQKQKILAESISNTKTKLDGLKQAQGEVEKMFKNGDIGEKEYREFQRSVIDTESTLKGYQTQMSRLDTDQTKLQQNTKRLQTLFDATGTSVDDFSDILGTRLTNAIKNGTASGDQLEEAINKIGRASLGGKGDVGELKSALDSIDDTGSIDDVAGQIKKMGNESDEATEKVGKLTQIAQSEAFMQVSEKAKEASDKIIEMGTASVEAAATMKANEAQFEQVFGSMTGQAHQVVDEMGEAMGILPKRLEPGYAAISSQLMSLGVDQQSAMDLAAQALTSSADAAAFYDTSLDSAQGSIQSFIKGNLSAAESIGIFATANGLSDYAIQKAGTAANETGKAYNDMSEAEKQTLRVDYVSNMQEQAKVTGQAKREMDGYENVMGNVTSASEELKAALGEEALKMLVGVAQELIPLLEKVVKWAKGLNPAIKQFITIALGVTAVIGAILPIIVAIKLAAAGLGVTVGTLFTGTILPAIGIIAAIAAAITAVILVIKNWGAITDWLSDKWGKFKDWFGELWQGIKDGAVGEWNGIKDFFSETWESISDKASEIWTGITDTIKAAWTGIADFFKAIWDVIYKIFEVPINLIKGIIEGISYAIYAILYTIWEVIKFALKAAWDWISQTAIAIFTPIAEFFSGVWNGIKDVATSVWETIKGVLSTAWNFIKDLAVAIFTPVVSFFSSVWSGIKDTALSIWNSIKDTLSGVWNSLKDNAMRIFGGMWDGIKSGFESLKKSLSGIVRGIANGIISPIGNAVNGVINGVNWILDKVGSSKQFALWEVPQFAGGTGGLRKDTVGIVNDQKGSTYKEMIVPPHGQPFIPEGRDVVLPMEKGTKIMPARDTKSFLESLPKFASGIGEFFSGAWESVKSFTGSIFDYITHPGKIVQIAIDKFTDLAGVAEPVLSIAKGAVSTVFDNVKDFIKGIFDEQGNVNYNPSAGTEQWRTLATRALKMEGQYNEGNLTRLLYQMQTESGGNPNAINNWDINAQNGIPSKGLMQVIDPTFRAYARPGFDSNIYDPLSNMLASIRYALANYGSLAAAYRGTGYEKGIGSINLSDLIPSLPMLDVKWFKDGGILTKPAFFQMGKNRIGGAGEDGPEAITPVSKLKELFQEAALEVFGDKNIDITLNITMNTDGREIAKATVPYTQPLITERETRMNRLRGVTT